MGRAVAQKIGHDVQIAGEKRDIAQPREFGVEHLVNGATLLAGQLHGARRVSMIVDGVIDGRARRGLPAFLKPHPRHHRAPIRPPHARHEAFALAHRHVTVRGAADQCQSRFQRFERRIFLVLPRSAQYAQPACVCVYGANGDDAMRRQAQFLSRLRRESAQTRAGRAHLASNALEGIFQSQSAEIIFIPAVFVAQIRPFANQRAKRARQASGCAPAQKIAQIEEMGGLLPRRGQVALEPQQFGRLHFRRNAAAHILQNFEMAEVDLVGLGCGAMIHPHHDIARRVALSVDGQSLAVAIQNHQRTSRIEGQAHDLRGRRAALSQAFADANPDGSPDVLAALLGVVGLRVPHHNRMRRQRDPAPRGIE